MDDKYVYNMFMESVFKDQMWMINMFRICLCRVVKKLLLKRFLFNACFPSTLKTNNSKGSTKEQ